jgi:hypothetical protein
LLYAIINYRVVPNKIQTINKIIINELTRLFLKYK